ncbi:MAG: hypothetical protein ACLFRQ_05280 [Desulfonatronovibrio sp.]
MNLAQVIFPRRSWYYVFLTVLTLGVIFMITLGPAWKEEETLVREMAKLKASIEEQQMLHPVYGGFRQALKSQEFQNNAQPHQEEPEQGMGVDETVRFLEGLAREYGLDEAGFSPEPRSLTREDSKMVVKATALGGYAQVTGFISGLAEFPFFIDYQRFELKSRPQGFEAALRIWVKVK